MSSKKSKQDLGDKSLWWEVGHQSREDKSESIKDQHVGARQRKSNQRYKDFHNGAYMAHGYIYKWDEGQEGGVHAESEPV